MTALLAARQRCEIHRSGAEIEKNGIVKSQYAGPIRIADNMVRKERSHFKRDIRFGNASRAGRRRTNSTPRERKRTELSARRGCGPMIASAPCIYPIPKVFCHRASRMAERSISRRPFVDYLGLPHLEYDL
jgi:hypothetical protein